MGKFSIGKFVFDGDGDKAEIIGKDGKYRVVRYKDGDLVELHKKWLRPVDDAAEVCPEKGKSEYSGASKGTWVPKVGDRVRVKTDENLFRHGTPVGCEGTITEIYGDRVHLDLNHPRDGVISQVCSGYREFLEPITAPAPLTITVGKSYRTRDGRKVGPMVRSAAYFMEEGKNGESYPFAGDIGSYTENGRYGWDTSLDTDADIVAEWVEAEPVAVASATATVNVKAGETWRGKSGALHTVEANTDNEFWPLKTAGLDLGHCKVRFWQANGKSYNDDNWNTNAAIGDQLIELVTPAPPIGSTVTFTATGRLSAINENGHYQVTFPGLPAGRNSFALPAQYVALAN